MDWLRRRPLAHHETLDLSEERIARRRPLLVSWESAILEAEYELQRARALVEALEALCSQLRERLRAGERFGG